MRRKAMNLNSKRCCNVRAFATAVVTGFGMVTALPAIAQTYPSKPIRVIVPFPPGGANDIVARLIGQRLNDRWARVVVIDNRGGAGGRPRAVNRVPACGMRTSASRDARR
jgi:tripartite-type tricarboxylate transporter receptor subunit TctC